MDSISKIDYRTVHVLEKKNEELSKKTSEIAGLKGDLKNIETENRLNEKALKEQYEDKLKLKDEQIEYYKDFKQIIERKIEDTISQVIQTRGIETSEDAVNNMIISLAYGVEFKEDFELQRICKINE